MSEPLPASWTVASMNEVAEVNGRSFCLLPCADGHAVHFVPMNAVKEDSGGIDVSARRLLSEVRNGYTAFSTGDVLFAKITPCMENGKVAVVPELADCIGFGSTEFHVIRASDAIIPEWITYFISQQEFRKQARNNMTGSAGQMRVPAHWLSSVQIPVAPRAEQRRVIQKLDEFLSDLDIGVKELKLAQKKLSKYRQSLLKAAVDGTLTASWREARRRSEGEPEENGARLLERILDERRARWEAKQLKKFEEQGKQPPKAWQEKYQEPVAVDATALHALPHGWVWASLDQLVSESSYGTSVKCSYGAEGQPVLRIPNVVDGELDLNNLKFAAQPLALEEDEHLAAGDVLVVRTNGSVGLVGRAACVRHRLPDRYYFASYLLRLRFVQCDVLPDWICGCLTSPSGRRWIEKRAASSAGQHNLSLSTLLKMPVPFPPLSEQSTALQEMQTQVAAVIEQGAVLAYGLKQAAAQRQNILRAAFSGRLVPQDPNDEPAAVLLDRIRCDRTARETSRAPRRRRARVAP